MPNIIIASSNVAMNPVQAQRLARNWSQAELAGRVRISRAAVSAIEGERLSPSVATALALAEVFECSVEELFGKGKTAKPKQSEWAWSPPGESSRYWEAEVQNRRLLYPVEAATLNGVAHDGVWDKGVPREREAAPPKLTLTLATCDPAAGILAAEYARSSGYRLLVFPRSGGAALELLRNGLVHLAALHRSTEREPNRNVDTVRERLGNGFRLLRVANWEEGIVLPPENRARTITTIARATERWAAREPGSGARECLDELLHGRAFKGREVGGHASVAEAVRGGWAGAGVCVRFAAEEARLNFLPVRSEALDICYPAQFQRDPRLQALVRLLRSRACRRLLSELPGYDVRQTGELVQT